MKTAVVGGPGLPLVDLDPFDWAGDAVQQGVADTFTAMMMALWSAGLWLIEMVFGVIDRFVTPDVADPGLGRLYGTTLWLSFVVALVVGLAQVGLAAVRRDGRTLGALVVGVVQYGAVVTMWVSVCAVLVLGCAGLTTGLLHQLLGVDGFAGYAVSAGLPDRVTGTVQSAVLGLCSMLLLVPAAFGYLLITLVREAALLILTATMPLAAAGALGEGTRAWLWKSIRWFAAACLTAPLLALVVGLGVQISRAAFPDAAQTQRAQASGALASGGSQAAAQLGAVADTAQQSGSSAGNVGMAVVGCVILLVACFCPMALFRLLAFVDPGTASGASFRSTMAANGGVSGLLSGRRAGADQGSGAATQSVADGRSSSEDSADAETASRFGSTLTHAFGAAGKAVGGAMDKAGSVAASGASMTVDVMGQAGVGHQGYYDTTPQPRRRSGGTGAPRTRVGHGWDAHGGAVGEHGSGHHGHDSDPGAGVAHDPAHIDHHPGAGPVADGGGDGEAAGGAADGAFIA
ncbi:hypothetical protein [Nocardioides aurantiacus]|uniref:TrbL/VirB6 plasmid conjugal transfer protein n=1 Tax=Nocardioides aurantiacus TaxID=86796 RepID=A0A3N2CUA6_9ACTN|nr:hypothetical protein [Nocardioides aurantiacus]ROR91123.1 hypothetical protein EDD33_1984 [Nocardioides aurantiacus]